MNLQLKGLDKRGRNAIYTGAAVSVRFPVSAFPGKKAPATIEVAGLARPMTAEERKAARAARPKLTPAEKLAKMEERLAKMRAELAVEGAATPAPAAPRPAPPAPARKGRK